MSGGSVPAPLQAKACLKFLQHYRAKAARFNDCTASASVGANPSEHDVSSPTVPVLAGLRERRTVHFAPSSDDSAPCTPTTLDCSASEFSTERSSSTTDDQQSFNSTTCWKVEVKHTFVHFADPSDDMQDFTRVKSEPARKTLTTSDVLPLSRSEYPSIGSALHSALYESGSCRPCAWFWKPQGCLNGFDCRHCHLCPASELKRRRKTNNSGTRRRKGVRSSLSVQEQPLA